jgi:AcrR family transcriptional regulator
MFVCSNETQINLTVFNGIFLMNEIQSGERKPLSARQLAMISHLIASPSVEEACRRAKISKPTVYNWFKDEVFKAELQRQREGVYKESLDALKAGGQRAVERLLKLINSKREDIAIRACAHVISANIKLKELEQPEKIPVYDTPFTAENIRAAWALTKAEEERAQKNNLCSEDDGQ